jgi:hypothetical protein
MRSLILNSSNIVAGSGNSKFQYNFPAGSFTFKDDVIGVQEIATYFSVFNITNNYNNRSYTYQWVDGTFVNVVIPEGFYQLADINAHLQSVMYANTHYLINSSGQYVYLLEFKLNVSQYAVQLNSFLISTTIATANSWVLPSGATWVLPTPNNVLPTIVISASQTGFGNLIGFDAGAFPSSSITGTPPATINTPSFAVSQSRLSTKAPQITPYSSFLVFCSLVNNSSTIPSQLIYSFTPKDATFGALQVYAPNAEIGWNKVENGQYNNFTIEFRDQLGNPVVFQDPNTLITLFLKNKDENS